MNKNAELDCDILALLQERQRTMLEFSPHHKPLNMYALARRDLEMSPGKLASQIGHAFHLGYKNALEQRPLITANYEGTGCGTKICMYAKNLTQLIRAYRDCQRLGLPCVLIIDRGHVLPPHFDGQPIITALGIGPVYRDEAHEVTKRYTQIN